MATIINNNSEADEVFASHASHLRVNDSIGGNPLVDELRLWVNAHKKLEHFSIESFFCSDNHSAKLSIRNPEISGVAINTFPMSAKKGLSATETQLQYNSKAYQFFMA